MTAIEIYRAQYEEERTWSGHAMSKYEWVACKVFDLTTYDTGLDEQFVSDILEVCKAILEGRTFEYIRNGKNYVRYILVCQLLNNFHWIEWGTSIRGAWFEIDIYHDFPSNECINRSRDILEELEWWDDEHHVIEKVPFTVDNLKTLIEFMEEDNEPNKSE